MIVDFKNPRKYVIPRKKTFFLDETFILETAGRYGLDKVHIPMVQAIYATLDGGELQEVPDSDQRKHYMSLAEEIIQESKKNYWPTFSYENGREYEGNETYIREIGIVNWAMHLAYKDGNPLFTFEEVLNEITIEYIAGQTLIAKTMNLVKLFSSIPMYRRNVVTTKVDSIDFNGAVLQKVIGRFKRVVNSLKVVTWHQRSFLYDYAYNYYYRQDFDVSTFKSEDVEHLASLELDDVNAFLDVSSQLTTLNGFEVYAQSDFETKDGDLSLRPIHSLSEMPDLHILEHTYPEKLKQLRILEHSANVVIDSTNIKKKQYIYVLFDKTKSMRAGSRIGKASAVLANRLEYVKKGEAEVVFVPFAGSIGDDRVISNEDEVNKLMKEIRNSNFYNGGSTHISESIDTALKQIHLAMKTGDYTRPEVLVITDGDENGPEYYGQMQSNGTKVHVFSLDNKCPANLHDFAEASNGVILEQI